VPHGRIRGLRSIELRGQVPIDPRTTDFFRAIIEERYRVKDRSDLWAEERKRLDAFLKVLANATSYGIFAEMNRKELPGRERATISVYSDDDQPFTTSVTDPEEPGAYFFSPLSACIAGAARLMLGLLERCVTDLGGSYAMCDTDSMAIVATKDGGLIPCPGGAYRVERKEVVKALSWEQVEAIRERFALLNPYDRSAVPGTILKLEDENFSTQEENVAAEDARYAQDTSPREAGKEGGFPQEVVVTEDLSASMHCLPRKNDKTSAKKKVQRQLYCYAISAKRYALFNLDDDGRPVLRKWSEHGLGHLLNPIDPESNDRDWIRQFWEGIVTEALGQSYLWPAWLDCPAIGRITASSPQMLKPFTMWNRRKPYCDQVKPCNFLLTAFVARMGHPPGVNEKRFHLVAPYESDPRRWTRLPWSNLYDVTGQHYQLTTTRSDYADARSILVKTYRNVLEEYRAHAETKSLAPDGTLCVGATAGLLRRRPVTRESLAYVGRESNRLEEVEAGLIHDSDEVYTEYVDAQHDPEWETLVAKLKCIPRSWLMQETGLARSTITALRNSHARPTQKTRKKMTRAAAKFVGQYGEAIT
jgi:hypothetical protein